MGHASRIWVPVLFVMTWMLGGCGVIHAMIVRHEALEACPVPPGGKRVSADDLWKVIWNQKMFDAKASSPMGVEATRDFYVQYLEARGWKTVGDNPPSNSKKDGFVSFHRGSNWGELIRWHYQSLDLNIRAEPDGTSVVEFHGWFEYAPATWPRYLVTQGFYFLELPFYALAMNQPAFAENIFEPADNALAWCVVTLF